jgi:hypothetical protein
LTDKQRKVNKLMAQITIKFTRDILTSGYYLDIEVMETVPLGELLHSIVLSKDEPVRIATLTEIEALPHADPIKWISTGWFNMFPQFISIGNHIHFDTIPPEWVAGGVLPTPPLIRLITDVDKSSPSFGVEAQTELPVGIVKGNLELSIWDSLDSTKLMSTPYPGVLDLEVSRLPPGIMDGGARTNHALWLFDDITTAVNRMRAFRAEAQSLADAAEMDEVYFTPNSTTEVFE